MTQENNPKHAQSALKGISYTALATLVGNACALPAQLALGWLLSDHDYGTYAIAISLSYLAVLASTSSTKLLIQRAEEYSELARPVAILTLMMNVVFAITIICISFPLSKQFNDSTITAIVIIIGISLVCSVPKCVMRARLAIDLQFQIISRVTIIFTIAKYSCTVLFALMGLGPLSFALPFLVVLGIETVLYSRHVSLWPGGRRLSWSLFNELFRAQKWILLACVGTGLSMEGGSFVIGSMESKQLLGKFYFGLQLTTTVLAIFNSSANMVFLPILQKIKDAPVRKSAAIIRATSILSTLAAPICALAFIATPPVVHLLWGGRWDESIPVAQVMLLASSAWVLMSIINASLESDGKWRTNCVVIYMTAIGGLMAAAIGCLAGDLLAIATSMSIARFVLPMVAGGIVLHGLSQQPLYFAYRNLTPMLFTGLGLVGCSNLTQFFTDTSPQSFTHAAISGMLFLTYLAVVYYPIHRKQFTDLYQTFLHSFGRGTKAVQGPPSSSTLSDEQAV